MTTDSFDKSVLPTDPVRCILCGEERPPGLMARGGHLCPTVEEPAAHAEYVADEFDVHMWFGLTYANYLVLHRSLLQSMPEEWQHRFVECLREMEQAFWHVEKADDYWVRAKDSSGRFITDPVPHYNRGRTKVNRLTDGPPEPREGGGSEAGGSLPSSSRATRP